MKFLDAALQGRNDLWRYLLGIGMIVFAVFFIGGLPVLAVVLYLLADGNPATDFETTTGALVGLGALPLFVLNLLPFVAGILAIGIVVVVIHRRPFRSLVNPGQSIRWRRIAQGAAVWTVITAITVGLEAVIFPGRYTLTLDLPRLLPFAVVALLLLPIQSATEELFFRGYLLQGLGLLSRQRLALAVLSGLLFTILHGTNPEVASDFWVVMSFYFVFGVAMALITLLDDGLELAIGVHAANNIFTAIFANFKGSALETPAIFTASGFTPWYNLAATVIGVWVFCLIFAPRWLAQARAAKK
jgi:membrane protease YdiL (CAAX protease family)